jgi:hypothetical protein
MRNKREIYGRTLDPYVDFVYYFRIEKNIR